MRFLASRIARAFRFKCAQLRAHWPAAHEGLEVEDLLAQPRDAATPHALARELDVVFRGALRLTDRHAQASESRARWVAGLQESGPRFECDASLGGLARWLRAFGYAAAWKPGTGGEEVWLHARHGGAVFVTSDGGLYERLLRTSVRAPVLWQPTQLRPAAQLRSVVAELRLERREPRCMACGGVLRTVAKGEVGARIPPRTARWLDDYSACAVCHRLFWRGTHWQRIDRALSRAAAAIS